MSRSCRPLPRTRTGRRMVRAMKLAEGAGFEPALRFPVNTLSKRAPSATRPPLRTGRADYRHPTPFRKRPEGAPGGRPAGRRRRDGRVSPASRGAASAGVPRSSTVPGGPAGAPSGPWGRSRFSRPLPSRPRTGQDQAGPRATRRRFSDVPAAGKPGRRNVREHTSGSVLHLEASLVGAQVLHAAAPTADAQGQSRRRLRRLAARHGNRVRVS